MKNLVCHLPTNLYVLNTHALHNYQYIAAVVPAHLRDEGNIPVVDNHEAIRLQGAKLVRAKKPVDLDTSVPTALEGNSASQEHTTAFDNSNKMRGKGKGKGKDKDDGKNMITRFNIEVFMWFSTRRHKPHGSTSARPQVESSDSNHGTSHVLSPWTSCTAQSRLEWYERHTAATKWVLGAIYRGLSSVSICL